MRAVSHGEFETRLIGAPVDWNERRDGVCGALSVYDWKDPETGHNHMISKWELEEGDLEKLQAGAPLFLSVVGQVHPVVCVYVGDVAPQPTDEAHDGDQDAAESANG